MTNLTINLDLQGKLISDRYYLYKLIASSSYSQVFLARDFVEHRKCIVKRLYLNFCSPNIRHTIKSMFRQEAEISKQLTGKHNQICQFYDYLRDGSSLYLVQEWIPGITLEKKLLQQKKLSESETRNILLNLLSVLEYIHGLGIIHRDIKPNNIVLREHDNLPVLVDFGIAQRVNPQENRHQVRIIAGTPGYMSSEQAKGQTAYNNDLYSLGLTAIHLLTGEPPIDLNFKPQEISISRNLMEVLSRAISPQPDRRFASAPEMRSALLSSTRTAPSKTLPDRKSKSRLKSWAVLLILGLQASIAGICWYYLATGLDDRPPVKVDDLFPEESLLLDDEETLKEETLKTDNIFQAVIFPVGTSDREILETMGEPVWRKPGFWENSIAWSYENVISEGIDLGYMFDTQTNKLNQAEIAAPPSTDIKTLESALISLLSSPINVSLEQGLEAVYQRQQTTYNFTAGDLQGIIQRNQYDRIYIAVWSAGFH